ncbi:MAG TPA: hypothetical protein VMZ30_09825 [Pyrinomonadaceae bacterium]|nr:hypothetical protein [Pyrinomonadaceae bacterium]
MLVFSLMPTAQATLVILSWTPSRILLAADSLSAKVFNNGQVTGTIGCKIHQQGDIFFTIVGVNDDATIKVDLVSIAKQAGRTKGTIVDKMSSFEALAHTQVERVMRRAISRQLGFSEQQRITVVFASRKDHIIVTKEYLRNSDGSTMSMPRKSYGGGAARASDFIAIGVYAEAEARLANNRNLRRLDGVPFIVGFMGAQFEHEQQRLKLHHQIPRVGGQICVLQIEHGKASWSPGYQSPCPDIKP